MVRSKRDWSRLAAEGWVLRGGRDLVIRFASLCHDGFGYRFV